MLRIEMRLNILGCASPLPLLVQEFNENCCVVAIAYRDRKDAAGKKPTDPAYDPRTLHLPADFLKSLSGGQVLVTS